MTSFILPWLDFVSCQIFDQDMVQAELAGLDYLRVASLLYFCVCVFSQTEFTHIQSRPHGSLYSFQLGSECALFSYTLRTPSLGPEAGLREEGRAGGKKRNGSWLSTCCPFHWHYLVSLITALFCQICFIFCITSSGWAFQAVISKFDLLL